jgi:nicotinate-nucleotide adenylyltransferase
MSKVCLLGGTFNPIHNGHIITAVKIREIYNFDKILFVLNDIPPHKKKPKITSRDRLNMLRLALKDINNFEISDIELKRSGVSYFIDTVSYFKEKYDDLYMLIGTDQANIFRTWYKWTEYFDIIKILVIKKEEELYETLPFEYVDIPEVIISSSEIKERVRANLPIPGLVPQNVENYINEKKLYR